MISKKTFVIGYFKFKYPFKIQLLLTSGGGDRRASGMAPFFRPGNISIRILFHPQIYEYPKFSDHHVLMTNFLLTEIKK